MMILDSPPLNRYCSLPIVVLDLVGAFILLNFFFCFVTQDGEGFKEPKRILKDDELNPVVRSSVSNKSHDGSQSSERDKTLGLSEISGGNIFAIFVLFVAITVQAFLSGDATGFRKQ